MFRLAAPDTATTLLEYDPQLTVTLSLLDASSTEVQAHMLRGLASAAVWALSAAPRSATARLPGAAQLRTALRSSRCLLPAVMLVDHTDEDVANAAEALVDVLYSTTSTPGSGSEAKRADAGPGSGAGAGAGAGASDESNGQDGNIQVVPFLEAGCVPELYRLLGSSRPRTVAFAEQMLSKLRDGTRGEVLSQVCRDLATNSDLMCRVTVAVALVYVRIGLRVLWRCDPCSCSRSCSCWCRQR